MVSVSDVEPRERGFIGSLLALKEKKDRGALAVLRHGLGRSPGEAHEMHRYVVPYLDPSRDRDDWRFYLVASLFANHPEDWPADGTPRWKRQRDRNMGGSFAQLRGRRTGGEQGVERRFTTLLSANLEDLPDHLRHAASLLKAEDVPVDYTQLLDDLRWWDHEERRVQRGWARAFWGAGSAAETGDSTQGNGEDIAPGATETENV